MTEPSRATPSSTSGESDKGGTFPPDRHLPENSQANLNAKLDHAIEETFPTSDPVSVSITKGGAADNDREASPGSDRSSSSARPGAEAVLQQVRGAAQKAAEPAIEAARDLYAQGRATIRDARNRYPEVERTYQDSTQAVRRQVTEQPWLSLLVAGAIGYGIAWLIHRQHN